MLPHTHTHIDSCIILPNCGKLMHTGIQKKSTSFFFYYNLERTHTHILLTARKMFQVPPIHFTEYNLGKKKRENGKYRPNVK